ncbi:MULTISPECIES: hypothetical protein [Providencia]|jgi:hypothetical protein|uniref:hypothetical protein n=1 Tax=Providencia TaxID=586 RepID=UPI002361A781|nr:hypothetical protein [Providencia rettgeri]ELR5151959.1 hypothetical protein [Providencia rettgeri]MDR2224623.1 hypothetical protein [Providencia sp.]
MNYQVAPFWINSGKLACIIVISLVLGFFSVSGFIIYLLAIGVVWAVAVSFKIHGMKEKGVVLKNSDISDWMVYIQGIPVEEKRQSLANPCFAILQQGQSFFGKAFILRALIQAVFCVYILQQIYFVGNIYVQIFALMFVAYILYSLWNTLKNYIAIKQNKIIAEELVAPSGSHWYRLSFEKKEKRIPALESLFAI